ncbi:hypothetical protein [Paenibacillus guangzhouensis]|uniref:hypothetical protein n=1 Tax=Paenibacillus guangzhouensis TaxID=1473112 RepID=UPI00126754F8|nr:hypothetical protein [Paenibacillus guangzhouensis]
MQKTKFFEGEKGLVYTGLLGFLLAIICGGWTLLFGGEVAPHGDVSKAFSFNAAIGIFLISTAALIPFSGMPRGGRATFRWAYILLALYSYGAETIQNFRGVNPRFELDGSAFDRIVGFGFAIVALLLVLFYLFFAVFYFRSSVLKQRPVLVLSIRYAMIAVLISFAAGIWISMNNGRFVGGSGNIIWLHGLGFHALQALPLVAWLAEQTQWKASARSGLIHMTGMAYILGLIALGWQTFLGHSILEWSLFPILAGGCFLISLAAGAFVLSDAAKAIHVNKKTVVRTLK